MIGVVVGWSARVGGYMIWEGMGVWTSRRDIKECWVYGFGPSFVFYLYML